jgi:phenylacetate-CoA ligase
MPERGLNLARMLQNERRPTAALMRAQDRLVREIVLHAAEQVPVYRKLYAENHVDLRDFRGSRDLARLPIIDKRFLSSAGADAVSCDAPDDCVTITTSGSTGAVFSFPIDRQFDAWRKAQYLRPYLSNGRRLTDKVLRLTAFPDRQRSWLRRLGLLREFQFSCAADPADIVDHWLRLAPHILQGYPSALRVLAQHCLSRRIALVPRPRQIFSDSELLTPDTRRLVERAFGTSVIDVFGTYETDNIAYQCSRADGYHVAIDCVVLEVIRNGVTVSPGETGELVVTVLRNRTTPLIRYNLHDIVEVSETPCTCGRTLPLLKVIAGRADDQLVLPDGSERSPLALIGRLDSFGERLREFQLEQTEVDHVTVRVVPSQIFGADLCSDIERSVRSELPGVDVDVVVADEIPRLPSGKLRVFVSRVWATGHQAP